MKWQHCLFFCLLVLTGCNRAADSHEGIVINGSRPTAILSPPYVVATDGTGKLHYPLPSALGEYPEWSLDGGWIASCVRQPFRYYDRWAISIMRSDGRQRVRVTSYDAYCRPTWSPDATHLAFESYPNIYTLDVSCFLLSDKCSATPVFIVSGWDPDWSPDGEKLAYTSRENHICLVNADGSSTPVDLTPSLSGSGSPDWSPDGKRIVLDAYQPDQDLYDIFVIDADGSNLTNLTNGRGSSIFPKWSPDGSRIAFVSDRDSARQNIGWGWEPEYPNALFVMDIHGTNVVRVSYHEKEKIIWYEWLPVTTD